MKKKMIGITTFVAAAAIMSTLSFNTGAVKNVEYKNVSSTIATVAKAASENITSPVESMVKAATATVSENIVLAAPASGSQEKIAEGRVPAAQAAKKTTASASTKNDVAAPGASVAVTAAPEAVTETSIMTRGNAQVDTSNIGKGVVRIKYPHSSGTKIKVKIEKGSASYMYNLFSTSGFETYPLQMGNGGYTITVYENVGGTSYKTVSTFNVALADSSSVFLSSNQIVNWSSSTNAVVKAREIAAGYGSNEAKAQAIHDYLTGYMKYDYGKASTVSSGYVPSISSVYGSGYGICYDFASTYAAMMRSVGIPAKLVMGYSTNVTGYHAWNKVYINGGWVIVDNSYDSQATALGQTPSMAKNSSQYTGQKEY
ncbi:MAG: transglutaminase family protein [Clostridiaceae bacterium]